jgi:DNA-binding transcriptional regulator YiaG
MACKWRPGWLARKRALSIGSNLHPASAEFPIKCGLTLARVRDWEQQRSAPDGAVRAYLKVIEKEPNGH